MEYTTYTAKDSVESADRQMAYPCLLLDAKRQIELSFQLLLLKNVNGFELCHSFIKHLHQAFSPDIVMFRSLDSPSILFDIV